MEETVERQAGDDVKHVERGLGKHAVPRLHSTSPLFERVVAAACSERHANTGRARQRGKARLSWKRLSQRGAQDILPCPECTLMKAYLYTTGTLFALIVIAHLCRMYVEPHLLRDPLYHVLTILAAALCAWAWRLTRRVAT